MTISRPLLAMMLVAGLAACATTDDPAKGGFFSGIANLSDGTYQQRVDDRQKSLENEQDTNLQQNRALERTQAQSADVTAQREAAEARYNAFVAQLNVLRARLAAGEKANAKKKTEIAGLTKQVDALQAKIRMLQQDTYTPDADKQKRLESLRLERDALNREVDLLLRR